MRLIIPEQILHEARMFLEDAGSIGCEGTGLLAGRAGEEEQLVDRFVAPDQRASAAPDCWVEVTDEGKLQLAGCLGPGERWVARIHSHPGGAFHSATDDANPFLTAEGAWSIVVPFFGLGLRRGISACAVLRRERGRWRELGPAEIARWVTVS